MLLSTFTHPKCPVAPQLIYSIWKTVQLGYDRAVVRINSPLCRTCITRDSVGEVEDAI